MTEHEKIWQYLEEHKQEFLDYWAAQLKDASEVERISYDPERIKGVLMSFDYQGVRKLVAVSPDDLLDYISGLDEEVRLRCIAAAESAEDAAVLANAKAQYAKGQGDRVDQAMDDLEDLEAEVAAQGNTAEAQGARAQGIYETVSSWYDTFKSTAETWYTSFKGDAEAWLAARKAEWTTWYTNGVVPEWATLKSNVQSATSAANDAATLANGKASLADTKAGEAAAAAALAILKAGDAETAALLANRMAQFSETQGNRAKGYNDHPWEIGNDGYIYVWSEQNEQMVRTNKMIIGFNDLTEAQKQALIGQFYDGLVFASEQLCRDIVSNDIAEADKQKVVNAGGLKAAIDEIASVYAAPYFQGDVLVFPATNKAHFVDDCLILTV